MSCLVCLVCRFDIYLSRREILRKYQVLTLADIEGEERRGLNRALRVATVSRQQLPGPRSCPFWRVLGQHGEDTMCHV